jgi:hypothetical protein
MQNQRPLNHVYNVARDGAAKKLVVPAPAHGQTRQTKGEPSAYHHGVTVNDEPNTTKTFVGSVPLHPATPDAQRAKIGASNDPKVVLTDAANLGRKA